MVYICELRHFYFIIVEQTVGLSGGQSLHMEEQSKGKSDSLEITQQAKQQTKYRFRRPPPGVKNGAYVICNR